jgi:putative redox protein
MSDPRTNPQTAKMKMSASCPNHSRTDIAIGDHEIIIDEPVARGGTDLAPSPTQTFMAALMGCTNVIINKCANDLGVNIDSMEIDMEVDMDRRGVMLTEAVDVPFPSITLNIDVKTNATDEDWSKVTDYLHKFCPIAVALRAGGTKITENWNLIRD